MLGRPHIFCLFIVLCVSQVAFAQSATELMPTAGPHGARVILIGSSFDTSTSVSFAGGVGRVPARLVTRTASLLEVVVPPEAVSGQVTVSGPAGQLAAFNFTVTPDAPFITVTTLAASDKAHEILKQPSGVAIDPSTGKVYAADQMHHRIVVIDLSGAVTTLAGSGNPGFSDGVGAQAQFNQPRAVAFDTTRKLLYVADSANNRIRIVSSDGAVMTLAGTGRPEDSDGPGATAGLKAPAGVAVDSTGIVYVADTGNSKIKSVAASGIVTTLAGGNHGGFADGLALQALFQQPAGVAVDDDANVYIADTGNHVIRRLRAGVVTTLAGTGHPGYADGSASTAEFNAPEALYVDDARTVFVADTGNHRLRRITAEGAVDTVAGAGRPSYGDGIPPAALFNQPAAVAGAGELAVADRQNDTIRLVGPPLTLSAVFPRSGSPAGGVAVRVFGTGFVPGSIVRFGGITAQGTYVSSTELIATAPPSVPAFVDVSVASPFGSAVLPTAYRYVPPYVEVRITPSNAVMEKQQTVQLQALGIRSDGSSVDISNAVTWSSSASSVADVSSSGLLTGIAYGSATVSARFDTLVASIPVTVRPLNLPPDPAAVAPAPDLSVAAGVADNLTFLWTGANPVQKSVVPGAILDQRVTALRGTIRSRDGQPLVGVKVTAVGHPELGNTLSRLDGVYDFAINGGGSLSLSFDLNGYITAQRLVASSWNEQKTLPDVVLVPYDSMVTTVSFGSTAAQVARSSSVSDLDGSREATMIVPSGTAATLTFANGATQSVPTLRIRATELTVGESGPSAMPAALPSMTAYTYCVELSADEVASASATGVQFSKPLAFYVDNFVGFATGQTVPVGYYDRQKGAWMSSDNGRVVKIVAVADGVADLDITGDGIADDASVIGVDSEERQRLATIYTVGQTLWRVPISHFTPYDLNWSGLLPSGAVAPTQPKAEWTPPPSHGCGEPENSIVDCSNQVLAESVPIAGTPFSLEYSSARVARSQYRTVVHVTGPTIPQSLKRVELSIAVAGQQFQWSYAPAPNIDQEFVWDGKDVYGREVQGVSQTEITIGYVYPLTYAIPDNLARAWAVPGARPAAIGRLATERSLTQTTLIKLGRFGSQATGFGGWVLDAQKTYDGTGRTIYDGALSQRSSDNQQTGQRVLYPVAGNGTFGDGPDGVSATQSRLGPPVVIATAPDGSFYVGAGSRIKKIDANGIITTAAGAASNGFSPDGSIAAGSPISFTNGGLAVSADGTLYFSENSRVRKIVDGRLYTVAGTGVVGYLRDGDGGDARQAKINVGGIAFGPDGSLYLAEFSRVRRIGPDNIIRTVALLPTGYGRFIAVAPDSSIVVGDDGSAVVYRIEADGSVRRLHGTTNPLTDGGRASDTGGFYPIQGIATAADGTVLVALGRQVWSITPDGIVRLFAGSGQWSTYGSPLVAGALARATDSGYAYGIAVAADGSVLVGDQSQMVVRRSETAFPAARAGSGLAVPSSDGSVAYIFENGRHVRTVDSLTGVMLLTLGYDLAGHLSTLTDGDENVTAIERSSDGSPLAIVAPGGQRTTLATTGGLLSRIANPANESYEFQYDSSGFLTQTTDPRRGLHKFTYDANGLLTRDEGPDGGFISLARSGIGQNFAVARVSAEGRSQSYTTLIGSDTTERREHVGTDGNTTVVSYKDATSSTLVPGQTIMTSTDAPDPRFGMQAPYAATESLSTGSITRALTRSRTVTLSSAVDPFSVSSMTETTKVNGQTWTSTYSSTARSITQRSPLGRLHTVLLDDKARVATDSTPGFTDVTLTYDSKGRISGVTQGSRTYMFTYDAQYHLASIRDTLSRTVQFAYDAAGRVIQQTLPDGRFIAFTYDAMGNVTSVTPPSRQPHRFTLTLSNLTERYESPLSVTQYAYNKDRQLTRVTRPDQTTIELAYDGAGRINVLTTASGAQAFTYDGNGRMISISPPDGEMVSFTYNGFLLTSENWSGTVWGSVAHTYDSDFRVVSENGTAYGYDGDGLLTTAGALSIRRDAQNGLLLGTSIGSLADTWTYNSFGEATSYALTGSGSEILKEQYARDAAGRITSLSETVSGATTTYDYGYDDAGRLATVTKNAATIAAYGYDGNGNRLSRTTPGSTEVAVVDADDRMVSDGSATYAYTANGELQTKTDASGVTTYTYDALGNLRRVVLPNADTIEYVIDGMNRRVGKKVNGNLVKSWLYGDQLRVVTELERSGTSRFVYGSRSNVPDLMIRDGVTYRIISDHLGSSRYVIEVSSGTLVQALAYDEFGNVLADSNPGFQPFGFAGGLYDRDTGLVRFGARDYDPHTGRWTTKDPILFAGRQANLFGYNFGDPVNFIDPSGLGTVDANVSAPLPGSAGGGTVGIQFSNSGIYPYAGVGFVSSPGWSIMASEEDASAGMFDSASANVPGVPLLVIGVSRPASNSCDIRQVSWQAGIGTKGLNVVRTKTLGEAHPVTWFQQFLEEGARQIQRLYGVP